MVGVRIVVSHEIYVDVDDPNFDAWERKEDDKLDSEFGWQRLGTVVLVDLMHETGLYDELGKRQRTKLDRQQELAIDPTLPLTRAEVRARKRDNYNPGMPIWMIPLLPVVVGVAKTVGAVEKYAKTDKPGSGFINRKLEAFDRQSKLSGIMEREHSSVVLSSLYPQLCVARQALSISREPSDYVVSIDELLEVAEDAIVQEGRDENRASRIHSLETFSQDAPRPKSIPDQRKHAAEVFIGSSLLRNGELSSVKLERRVQFFPDGPRTFRVHATLPYKFLYESKPPTDESYQGRTDWMTDVVLDPHPVAELLEQSRR